MYCVAPDCTRPAARGELCWTHLKRQRTHGTIDGSVGTSEVSERPKSPSERLHEAALKYADAEDDGDYARARDNLRKAATAYDRCLLSERTKAAMATARANGVRVGRPRALSLEPHQVVETVRYYGGARLAARALGVSVMTVWRALKAATVRQEMTP